MAATVGSLEPLQQYCILHHCFCCCCCCRCRCTKANAVTCCNWSMTAADNQSHLDCCWLQCYKILKALVKAALLHYKLQAAPAAVDIGSASGAMLLLPLLL
eukprot:GHRR01010044.1.p3 GENE.GHRR01010044.1~~GHRR01010044.1.p3  ORF type:complete len:101 (+),score=28.48 GHRR01010044.1:1272-1574(+)